MIKTVDKTSCGAVAVLLVAMLAAFAHAAVSVRIFSIEEAMGDNNQSRPRIYIQNTGTETINNFTYRYFFSTENGKTPALEPYYLPNEQIMLVPFGSGFYVQYTVTNANLSPGGLLPNSSGNCVGLHFNDWSAWDKTNDFSNNLSSSFVENQNISVYYNGTKIYGNEPGTTSGSVLREVWTNIYGTSTDVIPVNTTPQVTGSQVNLDGPQSYGDNFGVRIRGYITAPASGNYTFWIASDNDSKFYLSTNDDPANKGTPIAWVNGWTGHNVWNTYTSQKSVVKALVAGTRYYMEILHKEGDQGDHCSVGWAKPGQSTSAPSEIVPSSVLTPYVPNIVPAVPTNLVATPISSQRIDLSWSDASNNETGFEISRKNENGIFEYFGTVLSNTTSYTIIGLSPETQYQFKVRAYNAVTGYSDYHRFSQTYLN